MHCNLFIYRHWTYTLSLILKTSFDIYWQHLDCLVLLVKRGFTPLYLIITPLGLNSLTTISLRSDWCARSAWHTQTHMPTNTHAHTYIHIPTGKTFSHSHTKVGADTHSCLPQVCCQGEPGGLYWWASAGPLFILVFKQTLKTLQTSEMEQMGQWIMWHFIYTTF